MKNLFASPESLPVIPLDVRLRRVGDHIVVARADRERALGQSPVRLSGSAEFIWRLIDNERTAGQIAAKVAEEFKLDVPDVMDDVLELLESLAEAGVVRFAGPR